MGVQSGIRQSLVKLLHHPSPTPGTCSRVCSGCHGAPVSGGQWVSAGAGGRKSHGTARDNGLGVDAGRWINL